jgi:hypothetical protein
MKWKIDDPVATGQRKDGEAVDEEPEVLGFWFLLLV